MYKGRACLSINQPGPLLEYESRAVFIIFRRRKAIEGRRQKLYSTFNMLPSVCETNSGAYMH